MTMTVIMIVIVAGEYGLLVERYLQDKTNMPWALYFSAEILL